MNYIVTVAPRMGCIREEMTKELVTLIRKDKGNFGHESNMMVEKLKASFLDCRFFNDVELELTSDQVVQIYSRFTHTEITNIKEKDPRVILDLIPYSKR
jgi:hypothetical protein